MDPQEAEVTLKINDQHAREKFDELEKKTKELRQQFAEAFKKGDTRAINEINIKLQQTSKEMNNMRTNAANIRAALVSLDKATPQQLNATIKRIYAELNSGRVQRGTEEWDAYIETLKNVKAELKKVKDEMSLTYGEQDSMLDKLAISGVKWWSIVDLTSQGIDLLQSKFSDWRASLEEKGESQANLKALTGLDDSSIDWLTKQAEQLSTTMDESNLRITQSSKEILDAYMLVGSNKPELLGDKEALNDVTVEAMRLATAAKMELQPAVDAMTTALNQYGEGADQASRYVNVLAAGSKVGAANVVQQSASILKAGTAAASANVPIEQLVGSIEMLGEKGIKGEVAGTGLKKLFLTLQTGAKDTNPKVVGLSTALDNLKAKVDAAEKKSVGGGAAFLKKMFGEEAYSIASILTENTAKVKEYTEAVTGTQTAMEQAAINSDTTAAKMAQMRNTANEAGMAFVEALNPAIEVFAETTTGLLTLLPSLVKLITSCAGTIGTLTVAITAYNLYMQRSILLDKLKVLWQGKVVASFNKAKQAFLSHPYGIVAVAVGLLVGAMIDLYRANNKASASQDAFKKSLTDVSSASTDYAKEESARAKILYDTAISDKKSKEERIKAAKQLINQYPEYFGKLEAEQILLGKAKSAYDELTNSILQNAKTRAAADKIMENAGKIIDIESQIEEAEQLQIELAKARDIAQKNKDKAPKGRMSISGTGARSSIAKANRDFQRAENELIKQGNLVQELYDQREQLIDASNKLQEAYGVTADMLSNNKTPYTVPETDKERRERLKKAKEALKQELDERKSLFDQAEAQNLTLYVTGQKNYLQYCEERERMESQYADDVVAIHERHNKLDIAAYGAALKKKAEILKKHQDDEDKKRLKSSLNYIENNHKENTNDIVASFYDPDSPTYQNKKDLNQKLLIEDISYLAQKQKLYKEDSEEYATLQRQIEERVAQDQLDKKKETAEALAAFEQQYRKGSGSQREKMELEILADLHSQGLISEEEYQRAIRDIKDKYRDEDHEKSRKVQSEYYDMVYNLYTSFSDLFENLGKEGSNFWEDLSKAGEAAFAVMGAMLSQYSAYANAERDAEVAKIERRYDREIAAAGRNDKKKKKLEEKKEAEIAKVKKKYNDKAMKIELAQAFASTALAAINAYASASQTNWLLGPIAAALATAAGMMQIATIKKQHEAEAAGYYTGGFTDRDPDNRKEVGVVHANEFVMNHKAVANPALVPVLRLIDHAQRNNTVGSLTSADVSRAIGQSPGVGAGGVSTGSGASSEAFAGAVALVADTNASTRSALDRLSENLEAGIEAHVIMDGEQGFYKRLKRYERLTQNPKR